MGRCESLRVAPPRGASGVELRLLMRKWQVALSSAAVASSSRWWPVTPLAAQLVLNEHFYGTLACRPCEVVACRPLAAQVVLMEN